MRNGILGALFISLLAACNSGALEPDPDTLSRHEVTRLTDDDGGFCLYRNKETREVFNARCGSF